MISKAAVDDFVRQKVIAVAGVSRSGKGFGRAACDELRKRGHRVYVIHPEAAKFEGETCYATFAQLPEAVGGVLVVVPPSQTESVVRRAMDAGINRIWMQQGAESSNAIELCRQHGVSPVHGECILMYAEPVESFHRFHRWIWRLLGKTAR